MALTKTDPENITLGMLRLLPGHNRLALNAYPSRPLVRDDNILNYKASDGKLLFSTNLRIEFYKYLIDIIRSFNKKVSIGVCRETNQVLNELDSLIDLNKCNCITW